MSSVLLNLDLGNHLKQNRQSRKSPMYGILISIQQWTISSRINNIQFTVEVGNIWYFGPEDKLFPGAATFIGLQVSCIQAVHKQTGPKLRLIRYYNHWLLCHNTRWSRTNRQNFGRNGFGLVDYKRIGLLVTSSRAKVFEMLLAQSDNDFYMPASLVIVTFLL